MTVALYTFTFTISITLWHHCKWRLISFRTPPPVLSWNWTSVTL